MWLVLFASGFSTCLGGSVGTVLGYVSLIAARLSPSDLPPALPFGRCDGLQNPEISPASFLIGHEEEDALKGRKSFRGHAAVSQSPEAELMLEGEDDTISLLQEKDMDNLAGEEPLHSSVKKSRAHRAHSCLSDEPF
ncbi:neurobeachin isoform X1 [Tachysurus ichikawai]